MPKLYDTTGLRGYMNIQKIIEDAFTGLEASLVLIAFVVVASVFAYVILGAGFTTTQKSQEVVHTGVSSASSSLQLAGNVYGVSSDGVAMDMFNFSVSLAAGTTPMNFEKVTITYSNETWAETLEPVSGWRSTSTTPGGWSITGASGESGASNNILEKGEQFSISAHPKQGAPKNSKLSIELKPGTGSTITIHRTAPAAINTVNTLY